MPLMSTTLRISLKSDVNQRLAIEMHTQMRLFTIREK